ncbi:M48 family metallopeptidase [Halomonas urumqiensis]|uniref:Peptidase n=1 Tax=Halomonas urumqiensis TaxID=1684789 RepID=A0A2N7UCT8_9GAMM|nr:M48 family metallopeptidase [Halomonas urumqiensis]PMR78249.1 peptidase [Halomonas urumqiensis]PTB03397.1 peptidase [Halomonas urumqiensis]GHE20432.1 Zn-dependent protease [Halomonas urumqiensis]
MDFFTAQDRARRLSGRLVVLLVVAVAALVAATVLVVAVAVVLLDGQMGAGNPLPRALDPRLLAGVAIAVVLVVGVASVTRHLQLRAGGSVVAEALGGRPLNLDTRDDNERRLLNIVEEMAIASGMPVPVVYVLEDAAVNAFAAGHEANDAAIGITRGAIELLDRDQLQGVIAHEFSHILHGDMRLNLRLVALLHGILVIGLVGRMLLRGASLGRRGRSSRRGGGAQLALVGAGIGLMAAGYAGTLCGNVIKAAVSRQREFLADASAVQYTRNPEGIGGALKTLAAYRLGSRLQASNAAEFSHLYFGSGVRFSRLTATHPPLEARIRRVLPGWDGSLPEPFAPPPQLQGRQRFASEVPAMTASPTTDSVQASPTPVSSAQPIGDAPSGAALASQVVANVGNPDSTDLERARQRLAGIDPRLIEAAHQPSAARALVYGILMGVDPTTREAQRAVLIEQALPDVLSELERLDEPLAGLTPGDRLPLIELAQPVLRQLSVAQFARLRACLAALMAAETSPGPLQWSLHRLVIVGIEGQRRGNRHRTLGDLAGPLSLLLSTLALAGQDDVVEARAALEQVAEVLGVPLDFVHQPPSIEHLDWAIGRLVQLADGQRGALLAAMVCCVERDGRIVPEEAELLRSVAWSLGWPLPLGAA